MSNLIFSFNAVMPIFLVIGLGYFIRRIGLIDDHFVNVAIKFNFRVGLSTLLFENIYTAEISKVFDLKLIIFAFTCIIGSAIILWFIVPIFIKDKKKASAMIHTMYRSNFVFLGIPLAINIFGKSNVAPVALLLPIAIPTYNFLAVVILAAFDENPSKSKAERVKSNIIKILKNPLIIGSVLGILMHLFSIKLPLAIERAVSDVASLGTPLALITIGAQFNFENALENLKYSIIAALGRVVVIPSIIIVIAILIGFRGNELGAIFILFSAPTAVSSYVMAKEMNSDYMLTGNVVILSTLLSMFTIFIGIYLLRTFSFF